MMMQRSTQGRAIVVGRAFLLTKRDAANALAMPSAPPPVKPRIALVVTLAATAPTASQTKIAATMTQEQINSLTK